MPENVGRQRNIFRQMGVFLWCVATFKYSLGAARHSLTWWGSVSWFRIAKLELYDVIYLFSFLTWTLRKGLSPHYT